MILTHSGSVINEALCQIFPTLEDEVELRSRTRSGCLRSRKSLHAVYPVCVKLSERKERQQQQVLERGVEESRVVVRRRRAALVRLPVTWGDGRLGAAQACGVTAQERRLVVPALGEGEEPGHTHTRHTK